MEPTTMFPDGRYPEKAGAYGQLCREAVEAWRRADWPALRITIGLMQDYLNLAPHEWEPGMHRAALEAQAAARKAGQGRTSVTTYDGHWRALKPEEPK